MSWTSYPSVEEVYINQRITQKNVTFKLCQGLWRKRSDTRSAWSRGINTARAEGKNRFYWGKKIPCLWLVCVKVIWRADLDVEGTEARTQGRELSRPGLDWKEGSLGPGSGPFSKEQWAITEAFYPREWCDHIYALQRSFWLQYVNFYII